MEALFRKLRIKLVAISVVRDGQLRLAATVVRTLTFLQAFSIKKKPFHAGLNYARTMFLCNILMVGLWGHVIKLYVMSKWLYQDVAIDFALMSIGTSGYQYCTFLFRNRRLAKGILDKLGDFRKFDKPPGIEISDARLNALFKLIIITVICMTPVLLVLLLPETCEEDDYHCGLLYPAYIPGMMTQYRRKVYLILQLTSAWCYVLLGTGSVYIGLHMAEYIVLYLKHCQTIAKKTSLIDDFQFRKLHVISLVKYHQRILFIYNDYHTFAQGIFIVHATTTPLIFALMVQSFMINFQVQCFLIFAIWLMTLFVVCFMGQRMVNENDKLADIVYDVIPLDGDIHTAKILLLMLQCLQKPLIIPAGPLTHCGYALFLACMKATYSYLALIQSTRNS